MPKTSQNTKIRTICESTLTQNKAKMGTWYNGYIHPTENKPGKSEQNIILFSIM